MSPTPLQFRPYAPTDEAAVVALWQACGLTRPWNDPHRDIARKQLEQPDLFIVGTRAGEVTATAMAGYDGHRGWIYYVAVAPQWQGGGDGQQLLAHVEALLLARGCPKVCLQVRTGNAQALAFYARLGYQVDATVSLGKRLIVDGPADGG